MEWKTKEVEAVRERVLLRPLADGDETRLGDYFLALSAASKRVYGPHAFNRETAAGICREAGQDGTLRLLAVAGKGETARVIGYFILVLGVREGDRKRYAALGIALDDGKDCTLAPSVLDAYQNGGLGSAMLAHLKELAREAGRRRMLLWGGVRADNPRAVHFYGKFGFVRVGEFCVETKDGPLNNYDMIAEL